MRVDIFGEAGKNQPAPNLRVGPCLHHGTQKGVPTAPDRQKEDDHIGHFSIEFPDGSGVVGYILFDSTYEIDTTASAFLNGQRSVQQSQSPVATYAVDPNNMDDLPPQIQQAVREAMINTKANQKEDENDDKDLSTGFYL